MPPHCLKLKIGCVIMLLRNLDLKAGLCNGTRMKVCALQNSYIDAELLTGVSGGKRVFVPRIQLAPSDSNLTFVLKRRQFPVRLAYSMTINKSQGQTFDRVGVYLNKPCFSHGQLYVACSRTRAFNSLFFKTDKHTIQGMVGEKCYTNNVIFSNVLNL
ncbi:ATP-dependent DNA helicase PIF1-like [Hydra vulgaris]|uniref:ATP-dependent DNA helicase PIF1-like n=1 Tax=Hydra vulgaris TaxID=6087 RepID=A0ABM4DBL6_HYDVU